MFRCLRIEISAEVVPEGQPFSAISLWRKLGNRPVSPLSSDLLKKQVRFVNKFYQFLLV